jgi:hypothetical protein
LGTCTQIFLADVSLTADEAGKELVQEGLNDIVPPPVAEIDGANGSWRAPNKPKYLSCNASEKGRDVACSLHVILMRRWTLSRSGIADMAEPAIGTTRSRLTRSDLRAIALHAFSEHRV